MGEANFSFFFLFCFFFFYVIYISRADDVREDMDACMG